MKILMIVADGNPGGGTTCVLALAADLIGAGAKVTVCSQRDSYATSEAKRLGIEVIDGLDFFRSRIDRQLVRKLHAAVDQVSPDIVHVHGGRAAFNWVAGCDTNQLARTIYTVHGYQFWRKKQPFKLFAKQAERRISRSVYRTVYVSQSDMTVGLTEGFVNDAGSAQVIRNGIRFDSIRYIADEDSSPLRKEVAVLGRITAPKNPHLVLDIAKTLANEGYVFHFIGGGDLEPAVKERADREQISNVLFHGSQSHEAALSLMSKNGTFLMASLWEGLPIAPVEAMAMGLAVVISDVNGCREVVRDGVDGRVARSENLDSFTKALRNVVAEPNQTSKMIYNARERVTREFSAQRVLDLHLDLYRNCLDSSR
jgi:glycosyltransferase involved in cell wall biosynthesis